MKDARVFFSKDEFKSTLLIGAPGAAVIPITLLSIPFLVGEMGLPDFGWLAFFIFAVATSHLLLFGVDDNLTIRITKAKTKRNFGILSLRIWLCFLVSSLFIILATVYFLELINNKTYSRLFISQFLIGVAIHQFWHLIRANLIGEQRFLAYSVSNLIYSSSPQILVAGLYLTETSLSLNLELDHCLIAVNIFRVILISKIFLIISWQRRKMKYATDALSSFVHYGKWIGALNILKSISTNVDRYLISIFLTASDLAIYRLPLQLTQKIALPLLAFGVYTFSRSSTYLKTEFEKKIIFFTLALLPASLIFSLLENDFFLLWMGELYLPIYSSLARILFIYIYVWGLNQVLDSFLIPQEQIRPIVYWDFAIQPILIGLLILACMNDNLIWVGKLLFFKEFLSFVFRSWRCGFRPVFYPISIAAIVIAFFIV
jgi:O-antigen/teichoic acid export membrane protein